MKAQYVRDLRPYNTAAIVSKDMPIRGLVELIVKHPEFRFLCIVNEKENLLGIINRKHLFYAIFSHHVPSSSMVKKLFTLLTSELASDLVVKDFVTCKESDSLKDVINMLIKNDLDAIPVVTENGKLEGIVNVERLFKEWLM